MTEKITHYGRGNNARKFQYYTMGTDPMLPGRVIVYGWGVYEKSSVLSGQPMKKFLVTFESEAEAKAVYGDMNFSSKWTEPQVSVSHLPGENDPVPGGMYPDDIGGGYDDY